MVARKIKDLTFDKGRVLFGSCLDRLKDLADESIDSIVTDPPYELGFMGKKWDASGIAYNVELWKECLRVLKPGGHLLAFGGTRTYHRMTVAIEDAGFEIRDSIHWVYGSGFPKSLDVSKAIDKAAGAEREVMGSKVTGKARTDGEWQGGQMEVDITAPATDAAKQWFGWGTALKPAHEPIVLARKPLTDTVAQNVQEHGTGAINIDGCRVGSTVETWPASRSYSAGQKQPGHIGDTQPTGNPPAGRWPANIMFSHSDECRLLTCEICENGWACDCNEANGDGKPLWLCIDSCQIKQLDEQSGNNASRFFYCPKPGKKERNAGLESASKVRHSDRVADDKPGGDSPRNRTNKPKQNFHPTVKPVELMRYLCRLITPPGGTVLDPFLGSGTTAVAATLEKFDWVGCEMTKDYLPIIKGRVNWAQKQQQKLPGT